MRLDTTDPRNGRDQLVGQVTLLAQPTALTHQLVDALVAAQSRLNRPLTGHVGTQTHVREHVQALDVVARVLFVTRNHHPTRAVAARAVAFGQRVESQGQHILRQTGQGGVLGPVVQHFVVHLVRKNDQAVFARDGHNAFEQFVCVQGARRVVRVDHHNALGAGGDFGANIGQIGHPPVGLLTVVVHGGAARQTGCGGPQRVVGGGQEQFIAVVEQAIGGHDNQFTGAIAQIDIVEGDAQNALLLGLVHDRFARRENAFAVRVTGRIGQVANHVLLNFFRRIKAENCQVSDVQFDDFLPVLFHLTGAVHDGTANVITNVGELGRFLNGLQSASKGGCKRGKLII